MIEAQKIYHLQHCAKPVDPPLIALLFHFVPSIGGGAPQLPVLAEVVWRNAADRSPLAILVEIEQFRMTPHIGAVVLYVKRHIAHDGNVAPLTVLPEGTPLPEEFVLHEFMVSNALCLGLYRGIELVPRHAAIRLAQRQEQSEAFQPQMILAFEREIVLVLRKLPECLFQQRLFVTTNCDKLHTRIREDRRSLQILSGK